MSALPPDECIRRLRDSIDSTWTMFGRRPVRGSASGRRFRIFKRTRFSNSLQTYAFGSLVPDGNQTRIRCQFRIHPGVAVFLALWFCLMAVIGVVLFVLSYIMLTSAKPTDPLSGVALSVGPVVGMVLPAVVILLGYIVVRFCRWLARDERRFLTEFLCHTLQARPATDVGKPAELRALVGD